MTAQAHGQNSNRSDLSRTVPPVPEMQSPTRALPPPAVETRKRKSSPSRRAYGALLVARTGTLAFFLVAPTKKVRVSDDYSDRTG